MNNVWDSLALKFNTFNDTVDPDSADNVEIAWPVFLKFIEQHFKQPASLRALDYGCGTGMFCKQLIDLGFVVVGIDTSANMIKIAVNNLGNKVKFLVRDSKNALSIGKFNLITSLMVLQFVEDVEKTLQNLSESLTNNGLIIFAVHRPEYLVKSKISTKMSFGYKNEVNIYKRSSEDYDKIFQTLGFKKMLQKEPKFTAEFVKKYNPQYVTDVSEYLILGYQKK